MYLNETLLKALRAGETRKYLNNTEYKMHIEEQPLGVINLSTGEIVANDPLCLFETQPFTRRVTPGSYPVIVYVLHYETDKRVAFAEIRFKEDLPVEYELALCMGQNVTKLESGEFFGYGVDSGTGGFMDRQTCQELEKRLKNSEDALNEVEEELQKTYVHTYSTANVCLPGTNDNVVAFTSGFGDGAYPSYWGLNHAGEICSLITDFCILQG